MSEDIREGRGAPGRPPSAVSDTDRGRSDGAVDMLAAALDYHGRGMCVVSQSPGLKMPCVVKLRPTRCANVRA